MGIKQKRIISWDAHQHLLVFEVDGKRYQAKLMPSDDQHKEKVYFFGEQQLVTIDLSTDSANLANKQDAVSNNFKPELTSPLDGMVVAVSVKVGQHVKKNDPLVVIEAMKMENILHATHDAIIKSLFITSGNVVHQHQLLMVFEEKGEDDHARSDYKHE